jgi:hypothetical protein
VSDEIHEFGPTAAGNKVSRGRYAVDPSGHVVLVPTTRPIKDGWRLATQADIDACAPCIAVAPATEECAPPAEPQPEPEVASETPADAGWGGLPD